MTKTTMTPQEIYDYLKGVIDFAKKQEANEYEVTYEPGDDLPSCTLEKNGERDYFDVTFLSPYYDGGPAYGQIRDCIAWIRFWPEGILECGFESSSYDGNNHVRLDDLTGDVANKPTVARLYEEWQWMLEVPLYWHEDEEVDEPMNKENN